MAISLYPSEVLPKAYGKRVGREGWSPHGCYYTKEALETINSPWKARLGRQQKEEGSSRIQ